MKINWTMTISLTLVAMLSALIIFLTITGEIIFTEERYEMPNGVVCRYDGITGGAFGGATHEFYGCSDGKKYINPESYKTFHVRVNFVEEEDERK